MSVYGSAINIPLAFFVTNRIDIPNVVSLDGSSIGAFLGFLGIVCTTLGGVYVATRNNRSEKASVALQTLEASRDKTQAKQLQQRDERITYLEKDLADCRIEKRLREEELENDIDRLHIEIDKLRTENEQLKSGAS